MVVLYPDLRVITLYSHVSHYMAVGEISISFH